MPTHTDISKNIPKVKHCLMTLQNDVCNMLTKEDPQAKLIKDHWTHDNRISGKTLVISDGPVIEKAGVNFSHVKGNQLPEAATRYRNSLKNHTYEAMGISIIIHPRNPFVPTTHANLRFFVAYPPNDSKACTWWFGGGFDLTPYYGFIEDCQHWHRMAKQACDPFGKNRYKIYKDQCDQYFFLKHRNEPRGIGGLFFDDLNEDGFESCFAFIQSVGHHFILAYQPILTQRKQHPYNDKHRQFQCYRRGRYVEFNLIYDRGTAFGLETHGRTESLLMSLPPQVSWCYNWTPKKGSPEAELYEKFLKVQNWCDNPVII